VRDRSNYSSRLNQGLAPKQNLKDRSSLGIASLPKEKRRDTHIRPSMACQIIIMFCLWCKVITLTVGLKQAGRIGGRRRKCGGKEQQRKK
jgi:hypothetical protein